MRKTHARPSKRFVCGRCKRRIRWMSQVHRAGGRGQLVWCETCWLETRGTPPGCDPKRPNFPSVSGELWRRG